MGGVEDGIPSCPPQAPASDLDLGGGGSLSAGLMVCFLRRGRQSSGLKRHSTICCSRQPMTWPCFSSSRLPTWPSWPPLVLSPQPTRNWWMRHLVRGDPRQGLRREGHGQQKIPSLATIVGRRATASARSTRGQPAPTKPLATMLTPLLRIPWVAARRTGVGARHAPDGGGWQMLSIAVLMICVKSIIIMLYPHLPVVIPSTFHLPTLALPTPAPVDFTLRPVLPLQISTQRLHSLESEWQTASLRGLLLA
jgi:hypothetical protein